MTTQNTKTIALYNGLTFEQMNDSQKQDLAGELVKNEIYMNVNEVISELSKVDDSIYRDELDEIQGSWDYASAVDNHLNDLVGYELLQLLEEKDISRAAHLDIDAIRVAILDEFEKYGEWDEFAENNITTPYTDSEAATRDYINKMVPIALYDVVDDCIFELSDHLNHSSAIKAIYDTLESDDELQEYCDENNLDPEWDETYEFWAVSNWLGSKLANCQDIAGLTVWGRGCTGQAICLDYAIQSLAFDIYSREVELSDEQIETMKKTVLTVIINPVYLTAVESVINDGKTPSEALELCEDVDLTRSTLDRQIAKAKKAIESLNV